MHRSIAAGVFGTLGRTPLRTWSDPRARYTMRSARASTRPPPARSRPPVAAAGSVVGGWGRPPSHTVPGALEIAVLNG